jgi:hypothetical protein
MAGEIAVSRNTQTASQSLALLDGNELEGAVRKTGLLRPRLASEVFTPTLTTKRFMF